MHTKLKSLIYPNPSGVPKKLFAALLLISSTSAFAVNPANPGNLSYQVYSQTSAEIFWQRASDEDGIVVGYEIMVNGDVIGTPDALSYYFDELQPEERYNIAVTSIDNDGDRSQPVSLNFTAGDKTPSMPADDVAAPTGLTGSVYSSRSAEIFWDRPDVFGLTYIVTRNGDEVSNTDGISYYDNQLNPGTEYLYTVTAVNANAQLSVPVSVVLQTPGSGGQTEPPLSVNTPTGLTASVYSSSSIELMWDRPAEFGLTYDVTRNGNLQTTTDGVSFYESDLTPGTTYNYEVVAIDLQGQRSAAASVEFQTLSSGGGGEPSTSIDTPTGLTASIYSTTSAELMWNRPDQFGLTYDVIRNGELQTTTDGVSFYETTLVPGTTYTYEVIAIDQSSQRSAPAVVMVNTLDTTGGSSGEPTNGPDPLIPPAASDPNILEPTDLYTRDGYGPIGVLRVDLRTATGPGPCNADDESGCQLADVLADIDKFDDHTVDIAVHFQSDDFPDDGTVSNAELRLRGGGSRFGAQKSFRIKLDSKQILWRGERHLQLNKHPFDSSRIRNKLAMDVMSEIPNLPSLRTQFVNLWIDNGDGPEDYGLFTHVERVNQYFLRKREWNEDDNIYKAEYFRFSRSDLDNLQIDENGEAVDKDQFERTLEIENGEDHRMLVAMMTALHDPNRSYESVLDQYFDRDNVMAWVATNILLHQADAVRHNFILYNPLGTEKFYFVPWDYDEAMGVWTEPPAGLDNDSLRQRVEYGYAVAARNPFLENFYRLPGIHQEILATVDGLRQNIVTDESMEAKANHYINIAAPFQQRAPDQENNTGFTTYSAVNRTNAPGENAEALRSRFNVLMAPILSEPQLQNSIWTFSWHPATDVTGEAGAVRYRLQVATSPNFESESVRVDIGDIEDATGNVEQTVDAGQLPSGEYFARLIATPDNQPERNWQVSGNKLYLDGNVYYGALMFEAP